MVIKSETMIMSATAPREIFSMNPKTLDEEYEEYLEAYKPKAYSTIQNFIVTQKVTMLYRTAKELLDADGERSTYLSDDGTLELRSTTGTHVYNYTFSVDTKVSKMYVTGDKVIFVTPSVNKQYHDNYLQKTRNFQRLDRQTWEDVKYMLPKINADYETVNGEWVIELIKPCSRIYSLREILHYFGGRIRPEYVSAIIHRLYHLVAYLDIVGINHNGITVDNLFFAPGRRTDKGGEYTVDDLRFVGVFGGWFFSTWSNEKIKGMPKEVYEVIPAETKQYGYSSYVTDELAIKRVARELLGDPSGEDLGHVPSAMADWITRTSCEMNAYEEYARWERVNLESFGKRRFVDMDVSI